MPKTLQFRRGTTSELSTEAGAVGELFVDTTKKTVVVMDGSTAGGTPLAKESALSSYAPLSSPTFSGTVTVAGTLATNQTTFNLANTTATTLNLGGAATSITIGATTGTITFRNAGSIFSSTSYLKVPVGTDAQRPGSPSAGMVRYNSDSGSFEGYGTAWASLGGVKSVDGLTYIVAESSPGASNDELEFYAATGSLTSTKVGGWNQTRLLVNTDLTVDTDTLHVDSTNNRVGIGTSSPQFVLDVVGTPRFHGLRLADPGFDNLASLSFYDSIGYTGGINQTSSGAPANAGLMSIVTTALSFNVGGSERGRILSSGFWGIGTSNPTVQLEVAGVTKITNATDSSSTSTGSLIVSGGVGIAKSLYVGTNLVVTGNLTVNGTTTTVNSTTLTVDDKNIELGSVTSPDNTTADGGGITLKGATDKTFNWVNSTLAWTSSEHLDLASGKEYYINGTSVLNSTTLGSGVTSSSLTSVGTLSSLTVSGDLTIDTNTLKVDSANNRVGIGTTIPDTLLHVYTATVDGQLAKFQSTQFNSYISTTNGYFGWTALGAAETNGWVGSINEHPFHIKSNNTDRIVIASTGEVTISNPTIITTNSSSNALRITQTGSGNAFVVEDSANPDTTPFVINATGNVGIGNSSPTEKLDVTGNIKSSGTMTAKNVVASNGMIVQATTVTESFEVAAGYNAMAVGPITIAAGVTVTVPAGSRWLIL